MNFRENRSLSKDLPISVSESFLQLCAKLATMFTTFLTDILKHLHCCSTFLLHYFTPGTHHLTFFLTTYRRCIQPFIYKLPSCYMSDPLVYIFFPSWSPNVPASQLVNPAGTHSLLSGSAASRSMITHFLSPSTFTLIQFSHLRSLWV